ncbi:MAG: LamG domain-containing protein [Bacteroidetes bacterium]|nr:LamG domain-containing protein [Bacteroidota bacterium]MBU1117226.1 LamG domain-containing protein [Bacteroidota bacterium]MBU1800290.1 LamG domain-containing protein [Bacteroidota bacterium]
MISKMRNIIFIYSIILFFISSNIFPQNSADLQKGLLGYYSFSDNDAADESGNGNNGEIDGVNLEKDVSGERNGSYKWNDEDDKIKIPINISATELPKVTLCAWVYPIRYGELVVISNDDRGGDRKIFSRKWDRKYIWSISDGKGGSIGKTKLEFRKWTFVVATYDEPNKTASIYVDGEKTTGKTRMDMSSDFTLIGASPHGNNDFEALIDEVRIYDRILSKSEINALRELKPKIDNFEKKKKTKIYIPKQNNLIVRAEPSVEASIIGKLSIQDTLKSEIQVPSKGGKWNEWLKIDLAGKVGYVQLSYLNATSIEEENLSDFEKMMKEYTNWSSWKFWVMMILFLTIGLGGSFKFEAIDGFLDKITKSDYEGNLAYFPIVAGFSGFAFAFLILFWQDSIEYYLSDNFTIWPAGYGFGVWLVWIVLAINLVVFLILLFESLTCGSVFHGILRIVIQIVFAFFALYSVFSITIAVILIAFILLVVSILLGGLAVRYVRVR